MTDMDRLIDESRAWRIALVAGCAVLITRKADGRDVLLQGDDAALWLEHYGLVMNMDHPHGIALDAICDEFFDE